MVEQIENLINETKFSSNVNQGDMASLGTNSEMDGKSKNTTIFDRNDGTYLSCGIRNIKLSNDAAEFVYASTEGQIYPGALLQGKSLDSNFGSILPLNAPRSGGTLTLNAILGEKKQYSQSVNTVSNQSVTQAVNGLISGISGATAANLSLNIRQVFSQEEVNVETGASFPSVGFDFKAKASFSKETSTFLVSLNQKFFSISYAYPQSGDPTKFFDIKKINDIVLESLKKQVSKDNPPLFVSSVSYGRLFYLLFQTNEVVKEADFRTQFEKYTGKGNLSSTLRNSSVVGYALGGNASEALNAIFSIQGGKVGGVESPLRKFLNNGSFSNNNPAVAISYRLNLLSSDRSVALRSLTDVSTESCVRARQFCNSEIVKTKKAKAWNHTGMTVKFHVARLAVGQTAKFSSGSEYGYTVGKGGSTCAHVYWSKGSYMCSPKSNSTTGKWESKESLNTGSDNACEGSYHSFGSNVDIHPHR